MYLPIAIAAAQKGYKICVLVGTNLLIDQLKNRFFLPYFKSHVEPYEVKGIENYPCKITCETASYGICTPNQREICEIEHPDCSVIVIDKRLHRHNFIFTNFHKYLARDTKIEFNLVIIDDSHGFENAIEDKFLTRITYYNIDRLYRKYENESDLIADFTGEFLDLFDDAFGAVPKGMVQRRLPNDTVQEISKINNYDILQDEIKNLNGIYRTILYNLLYFVNCCKNSTINTFYFQKDYYRQDDPFEAALIARKSETFQQRMIKSLFKDSRVIFSSATPGNLITHATRCTNRQYNDNNLIVVPNHSPDIIKNWFQGLTIFETHNLPYGPKEIQGKSEMASKLLSMVPGKALLLFKSYRDQHAAERIIKENVEREITFIEEGFQNEEVQALVEKADIIMASASARLWEGIDIKNLKFEIIFSLPFIRPPVHMDLTRSFPYVRRKMLIRLQQGIGRIIRSKNDKGMCVVLDERLATHKKSSNFGECYRQRIKSINVDSIYEDIEILLGDM